MTAQLALAVEAPLHESAVCPICRAPIAMQPQHAVGAESLEYVTGWYGACRRHRNVEVYIDMEQ
jgi:hypothetical protein